MISPRYLIAHQLLPAFLREQGAAIFHEAVARGDSEFLLPVWIRAGIRYTPRLIDMSRGKSRVGVMTLPMPRESTEAYLAALVSNRSDDANPRYFLLEMGTASAENEASTIIGEWTQSVHSNFGAGPPVTGNLTGDCASFVERVLALCESQHERA